MPADGWKMRTQYRAQTVRGRARLTLNAKAVQTISTG